MGKVGGDGIGVVVNVEVWERMVIVGSGRGGELSFVEEEEGVDSWGEVEVWNGERLGKGMVDV